MRHNPARARLLLDGEYPAITALHGGVKSIDPTAGVQHKGNTMPESSAL